MATKKVETNETIAKPADFNLDRFKSRRAATIGNVETLLTLPHHNIAQARDFVRLHPDEDRYWTVELSFVNVPIKGARDTLHLIDEEIATRHLPGDRVQHFRLALAAKPFDVFFLCHVPSKNLDSGWNKTALEGCVLAKTQWVQASSRRNEGIEAYAITRARDPKAFPTPAWLTQSLNEVVGRAFTGRIITEETHPGLLRLIGAPPLPT